jgi:hypothetical protein
MKTDILPEEPAAKELVSRGFHVEDTGPEQIQDIEELIDEDMRLLGLVAARTEASPQFIDTSATARRWVEEH